MGIISVTLHCVSVLKAFTKQKLEQKRAAKAQICKGGLVRYLNLL